MNPQIFLVKLKTFHAKYFLKLARKKYVFLELFWKERSHHNQKNQTKTQKLFLRLIHLWCRQSKSLNCRWHDLQSMAHPSIKSLEQIENSDRWVTHDFIYLLFFYFFLSHDFLWWNKLATSQNICPKLYLYLGVSHLSIWIDSKPIVWSIY